MRQVLLIAVLFALVPAAAMAVGLQSPIIQGNRSYALTSGTYGNGELASVDQELAAEGYTYRVAGLPVEFQGVLADTYRHAGPFWTAHGLFSPASATLCTELVAELAWLCDIGTITAEQEAILCAEGGNPGTWSCEYHGWLRPQAARFPVLIDSELVSLINEVELPFCTERCYDARGDDLRQIGWSTSAADKSATAELKKGLRGYVNLRPYGDGCFVGGELKLCISGGQMTVSFTYPDSTVVEASAPLQMKFWNSVGFSISPNFMALFVRQHGTSSDKFIFRDLGYKPIDGDVVGASYPISLQFKKLSNDPYEFIAVNFVNGTEVGAPFCSEQVAACKADDFGVHAWSEDGAVFFGGFQALGRSGVKRGFAEYVRQGAVETHSGASGLLQATPEDPGRGGAVQTWRIGSTSTGTQWGVIQKATGEWGTELVGQEFRASNHAFTEIGVFRDTYSANTYPPGFYRGAPYEYYGFYSNRRTGWVAVYYLPNPSFWTDTGITPTLCEPGEVWTRDGCFKNIGPLCPSDQVELGRYGLGGQCYTYTGQAGCWGEGQVEMGDTRPGYASYCGRPTGVAPDVCPADGRPWTLLAPPQADYLCRTASPVAPKCPEGNIQIGSYCYSSMAPVCPAGQFLQSSGYCYASTAPYCPSGTAEIGPSFYGSCQATPAQPAPTSETILRDPLWGYDPMTGWSCKSGGVTVTGDVKVKEGDCSATAGKRWYFQTQEVVDGQVCDGAVYSLHCGCPGSPEPVPSGCLTNKTCPVGYYFNGATCIQTTVYACPNGYWYSSAHGACLHSDYNICTYGQPAPNDYGNYDAAGNTCYAQTAATCSAGTRYADPSNRGYGGCFDKDTSYGDGTAAPYCKNAEDIFYNPYTIKRCYRPEEPICSGLGASGGASDGRIVLGRYQTYQPYDWVGTCFQRTTTSTCPPLSVPMRGRMSNDWRCMRANLSVTAFEGATPLSVSSQMCAFASRALFGSSATCVSSANAFPYDAVSAYRRTGENVYGTCPLENGSPCVPVAGDLAMCGTNKPCLGCSDGENINDNTSLTAVARTAQAGGKAYGISREQMSYIDGTIGAPPLRGRMVTQDEAVVVSALFDLPPGAFWVAVTEGQEVPDSSEIRLLAVAWDNPNDAGFLAECQVDDNGDSVCSADLTLCAPDATCPLGNYPCQPLNGQLYCSRYSAQCGNLADPDMMPVFDDDTPGQGDLEDDGTVDEAGQCSGTYYVFNGSDKRCRTGGVETGGADCCVKTRNWFGLGYCREDEKLLSTLRMEGKGVNTEGACHEVGEYCAKKLLGVCIQKKKTFCCFSGVLQRLIQEGAREQLASFGTAPWGDVKAPNCRGLTPEEFGALDLSRMNLSEYYDDVAPQGEGAEEAILRDVNQAAGAIAP